MQSDFFFCCAPLGAATFRRGQSKKKNTTWPRAGAQRGFSFPCLSPGPEQKKHPGWCFFFFALAPCRLPTGLLLPLPFAGAAAKKKKHPGWCFFFCSGPVPASNGASPSLAFRRGRSKKKKNTLGGVFFFALAPCRLLTGLLLPLPFAGAAAKKKTPWVVFFFCCGPARTLTHSLRAWVAMPPPRRGGVFFFAAAPPGPGWCFFFFAVAPPGRSLTHGGLGRFRQGPGGVFFLLRPRRVFLDNSKKCLGYYIGSKKTRRGHSKKKNTTSPK